MVGMAGLNAGGGGGRFACVGGIGWIGVPNAGDDDKAALSRTRPMSAMLVTTSIDVTSP